MDRVVNATEENIKVVVRIRPKLDGKDRTLFNILKSSNTISVPDRNEFSFDKVADADVTQEEIFESCKGLFQSFVDGYNATIFAYGQTGSGKTYTMTGDSDETGATQNPGLIPRGLDFIFEKVNERAFSKSMEYLIKCTFVEIYNEQIYDLLDPQLKTLTLRVNISQEVYLESCTEMILESPKMAEDILKKGLSNRHVASTEMNRESSRSHAVFTIVLESRELQGDIANIKKSSLHLVDLAGSERQRDAKTDGLRLKEAGMINKSLLALSMVIRKLTETTKGNKTPYIAYRDSKLTLLLRDSIGGNSKTSLVACVHNDMRFSTETWSTLHFANSVKMIVNKAKINVDIHGDNESLRQEIRTLREQIENFKSPQTIMEHEFDFDLVWKKRFISAMALRSHLSLDVTKLTNSLAIRNNNASSLEKINDHLKTKIELLEHKLYGKVGGEDEIADRIDSIIKRLDDELTTLTENVKIDQMQITISHLEKKLFAAEHKNLLSMSDEPLIHSLMREYNNIVSSEEFENITKKLENTDAEVILLKQQLAESKLKNSNLKRKIQNMHILHREERKNLNSEICSMKSNLKVADQQREAAVIDRRKTLLSVQQVKNPSPISNFKNINCRRRTQKKPAIILEDINSSGEFVTSEEFFKKNADNLSYLDKVSALEAELRLKQSDISKLEFNIKEYKSEISELKSTIALEEDNQKNITDLEIQLHELTMSLQESKEMVLKLQKENSILEVTKDKTIKILSEKNYSLEETIREFETTEEMYKTELERLDSSLMFREDEMKQNEEALAALENANKQKDLIIASLNSQISGSISVHEEIAMIKERLAITERDLETQENLSEKQTSANISLREQIDQYRAKEKEQITSLSEMQEELALIRKENINVLEDNESLRVRVSELETELRNLTDEKNREISGLVEEHKRREEEFESSLEKNQMILREELDRMKIKFQELERNSANIRLDQSFSTPRKNQIVRIPFMSPNFASSPIARRFTQDSNSRNSLLDDLIASTNQFDGDLKEKSDLLDAITTIVSNVFEKLDLPHDLSDTLLDKMATLQARLISYKDDVEELVIKNTDMSNILQNLRLQFDESQRQRDAFQKDLSELNKAISGSGEVVNSKQRIKLFELYKQENVKLRTENINLLDQRTQLKIWMRNNKIEYPE